MPFYHDLRVPGPAISELRPHFRLGVSVEFHEHPRCERPTHVWQRAPRKSISVASKQIVAELLKAVCRKFEIDPGCF